MKTYKIADSTTQKFILDVDLNKFIPLNLDNTDYTQFKKDLIEGAELQNAEGEVMTKADITEFMRSLP